MSLLDGSETSQAQRLMTSLSLYSMKLSAFVLLFDPLDDTAFVIHEPGEGMPLMFKLACSSQASVDQLVKVVEVVCNAISTHITAVRIDIFSYLDDRLAL